MRGSDYDAPPSFTISEPKKTKAVDATPDAGLRSLDHYKRALPQWRYAIRQRTLPLIRWETPYLAWMQAKLRTPALDSYFAITANLGTHTFFMIGLPILFWCGRSAFGKGLVHILALGVFWTGFVKDFFSLPRPLSPPLQRITMSGSAALEYGFPSTHSANAVSVAVYSILCLRGPENAFSTKTTATLEGLAWFYALSIVIGRIYCGMHGFLDILVGSIIGGAFGWLEFEHGASLDAFMHSSSWVAPVIVAAIVIVLVRIHPEPADDCPCFDDSVAFAGVVIGLEFGTWSYGKIPGDPWQSSASSDKSIDVAPLGILIIVARLISGVLIIFAWRETMKPALLKCLPHLFRWIENVGLTLPRRFFTPASEYKSVPPGSRLDTLFPAVSDIPRMVESIRHPTTRGRAVSVGPQSAADAYETLAYRERRRRESGSGSGILGQEMSLSSSGRDKAEADQSGKGALASGAQPKASQNSDRMTGEGDVLAVPNGYLNGSAGPLPAEQHELEEEEMFSRLVRPRVRYDVEVVTKLVVYTGIAWFATALVPIMYEFVGLGTNHLRVQ